jgi:carbon-monoxide dehydrogenase small subunit
MTDKVSIQLEVNGRGFDVDVPPRRTLADTLRRDLGFTGVHLGCEHGVCGACTVLIDGATGRSCCMLAVQADGASITTVEGLADGDNLHPLQQAFWNRHGLQCGFCTPGMLITACELLQDNPNPSQTEIREGLSGNLCRCTGYQFIVEAVQEAAETMSAGSAGQHATG